MARNPPLLLSNILCGKLPYYLNVYSILVLLIFQHLGLILYLLLLLLAIVTVCVCECARAHTNTTWVTLSGIYRYRKIKQMLPIFTSQMLYSQGAAKTLRRLKVLNDLFLKPANYTGDG